MSERVLVLRDAVVKITQMLSGKGIKVTQRGISAYVKCDHMGRPIVVNLPYLPDNATEELCAAIQGFLDHEVAHIMFSDFSLLEKAVKAGCMPMLNILEDARIEKAMGKRFSGCSHNLSVTGKFFLDKYTTPMMNEAMISGDSKKLVAVLMVPMIRAMSGQYIFKEFMADKMIHMKPITDKIADLQDKIEDAASTQDCLDLAVEIEKRLRDPGKPNGGKGKTPEDKGEGADGTKSGSDKSAKSKETKSEEAKDKDEKHKGDKSKEEKEEKKDEGASDDKSEEPKSEEDEKESKDGSSGTKAEEEKKEEKKEEETEEKEDDEDDGDSSISESESGESSADDSEGETSDTSAMMDEIDKENKNGYEDKMSEMISSEAIEAAKGASYLVYTKDDDVIEPLKVGRDYQPEMFKAMAEKVDHMVGPLQKDLERAIAARSLSTWEAGKRSGRLHSANLSRLATGDSRVFRRKHESVSKDVAVSLVIDASGSMSGEKINLATQSAYALSAVLERIGIKHEVICFTTGHTMSDMSDLEAEAVKIGRRFSRVEPIYMPVLKGFEERLSALVKERFGWLPYSRILRNNIDGECVEIATRRLKQRREAGKVMIVLSDGMPNAAGDGRALRNHLVDTIKATIKSGVNVVGIGIMTSSVTEFYPKNIVINDVNELPDRVVKELKRLLTQS